MTTTEQTVAPTDEDVFDLDIDILGEAEITEEEALEAARDDEPETNKYFLFEWHELEKYQAEYKDRLDEAEAVLPNIPPDISTWRSNKVAEWAKDTANEQRALTGEQRWLQFPVLIKEFMFSAYGLSGFLDDPNVSEIHLDGLSVRTVTHHSPEPVMHQPIARTEQEFLDLCRNWVNIFGEQNETLDRANPYCNITLPNGDRMHVIAYLSDHPANVTIRRHDFSLVAFDRLVENKTMTQEIADFLKLAVKARANIIIAGSTGSGKTTLMRCCLSELKPREKVVIIEDTKEIGYLHAHPDRWGTELRSRVANTEGEGEITMEDLIVQSLRMTPSRVIVGEVRGKEALPMLLAMSQGNDGSLATIHANSAKQAVDRLLTLTKLFSEADMSDSASLQTIAYAVELIVFLKRVDGKPRLTEIVGIENTQMNSDGKPALAEIVNWDSTNKKTVYIPQDVPLNLQEKLGNAGWQGWDKLASSEIV